MNIIGLKKVADVTCSIYSEQDSLSLLELECDLSQEKIIENFNNFIYCGHFTVLASKKCTTGVQTY